MPRTDSGTYVGDNTVDRLISTAFQPGLVFVKRLVGTGSEGLVWRTSSWPSNTSATIDGALSTNQIRNFEAGGFRVGNSLATNGDNTETYHWVAFNADNDHWATGSYTGDGIDNRGVDTGVTWSPGIVIVQRVNTSASGVWKSDAMGSNNSLRFSFGGGFLIDQIKTLGATFTVGTSLFVNASNDSYVFLSLRTTDASRQGTYDGNATDNRKITTTLAPQCVFIQRRVSTEQRHAWRPPTTSGDASWVGGVAGLVTDAIQQFFTDGFEVGTRAAVNTSDSYYWFIMREFLPAVAPTIPTALSPAFPGGAFFTLPSGEEYASYKTTSFLHHLLTNARIA